MKIKPAVLFPHPVTNPAQHKRFKALRDSIAGELRADAAQAAALVKSSADIDRLLKQINALAAGGDASPAAATKLSTLRTQHEILSNKLANAQRAGARRGVDKPSAAQVSDFNVLTDELAEFFKNYLGKNIQRLAVPLAPLFYRRDSSSPFDRAVYFVRHTEPMFTFSTRFIVQIRERANTPSASAATRLVKIVDALLGGKDMFAADGFKTL